MQITDILSDTSMGLLQLLFSIFLYVVFFLLPIGALSWLVSTLLSIPLRRRERARFFLDLLETILARGQPVESSLVSMAACRDRSPGVRFHLVAAHLENGLRLGDALERVPRFLPPQISAMLRVGERLGNLSAVLPACRAALQDNATRTQSATHYAMVLLLAFSPVSFFVMMFVSIKVMPSFQAVWEGMMGEQMTFTNFTLLHLRELAWGQLGITLLLMLAAIVYLAGPRLSSWLQFGIFPFIDWMAWRVPWKRTRLQRTFSAMLAVLLDHGVPEAEAVGLAGDCTANAIGRHRAHAVVSAMQQGIKLSDAVKVFDRRGEFHWRLTNAIHSRGGFLAALRGWHETLDARAFQQEETVAHLLSTGLVVLNGVVVGLIVTAVFGILISLITHTTIW